MEGVILGIILILGGILSMCVGMFDMNKEVKFSRKLTEALYTELGYKYDPNDNAPKTLFNENSEILRLKEVVGLNPSVYWSSQGIIKDLIDIRKDLSETKELIPKKK